MSVNLIERLLPGAFDRAPGDWTPERQQRCRLLKHCDGDVDAARPIWAAYARERFARWLYLTDRIGEGVTP